MTKRILLIEDDPFISDIYQAKFKEAGFEVKTADNGDQALILLQKDKPDLILLDIVLPGLDGWQFLRAMRQKSELKNIPVVILSNLDQKLEIDKGLGLGAAKYLVKAHYTPSEVVEEVIDLLRERKRERSANG